MSVQVCVPALRLVDPGPGPPCCRPATRRWIRGRTASPALWATLELSRRFSTATHTTLNDTMWHKAQAPRAPSVCSGVGSWCFYPLADVVDQERRVGPSVVQRGDAVVLLRPRRVPDLKAKNGITQMHRPGQVGTWGRGGGVGVIAAELWLQLPCFALNIFSRF